MKCCLALMFSLLFLVGCASQGGPDNKTKIMIWHYYSGEQKKAFDNLIAEFNSTYGKDNGIIVEADTTADINLLIRELESSFNGDPGSRPLPDAFFTYSDSAYPLAGKGLLASYDDYLEKEYLDGFVDAFISEGRFLDDGKLYIMPVAKATEVIVLNKTDFDLFLNENGNYSEDDLATWEGIAGISEGYYKWSEGKTFFGVDSVANFIIISSKQNGVDIFDNVAGAGVVNIDEKVMRKVWDIYYINMIKNYFGAFNEFRSDDVKTGELLAYLGSTTSGAYFPEIVYKGGGNEYPIEMAAYMMPVYEGAERVAVQQGAGIAMVKATPEKEYAVSMFIKWFNEPDRNIMFSLSSSYLPVTKEAIEKLRNDDSIMHEHVSNGSVMKVLKAALKQMDEGYQLYLTKPFDTSYDMRISLQNALQRYTEEASRNFIDDLEEGADYEEVLAKYTSEDNFKKFLERMNFILLGGKEKNGATTQK